MFRWPVGDSRCYLPALKSQITLCTLSAFNRACNLSENPQNKEQSWHSREGLLNGHTDLLDACRVGGITRAGWHHMQLAWHRCSFARRGTNMHHTKAESGHAAEQH